MRILFLVRSLHLAGAERQLTVLAQGLRTRGHFVGVAVLYGGGELEAELLRAGVPIYTLRKRSRWDLFSPFVRIISLVRANSFEVIHGYMTVGNLLAFVVTALFSPAKRVAGIRASQFSSDDLDWITRTAIFVERKLFRYFHLVICNSKKAMSDFSSFLDPTKTHCISNGIDCELFDIDHEAGFALRETWAIPNGAPVLGAVMRADRLKDAQTLFQVSRAFLAVVPSGYVLVVGQLTKKWRDEIDNCEQSARFVLLGRITNMRAAYNAMSVLLLCSTSEGFPNVIAEALACGTKCVTTDVGDAAGIVLNKTRIVPVGDVSALTSAVISCVLATDNPFELRESIVKRYDQKILVDHAEKLLSTILIS